MSLKYGIAVRFDNDVKDLAKQFPKAGAAVLNRAVAESQKLVVDKLFADYNLPKNVIKKRTYVVKANSNNLWATIKFSQRGINPFYFLKSKEPTVRREPILLEIKRGSTMYPGNKFFANIGKKSGLLKVMRQEDPEDREKLTPMKFIKGSQVFKSDEIIPLIRNYVEPYLRKELPRVIEAWFKMGKDVA